VTNWKDLSPPFQPHFDTYWYKYTDGFVAFCKENAINSDDVIGSIESIMAKELQPAKELQTRPVNTPGYTPKDVTSNGMNRNSIVELFGESQQKPARNVLNTYGNISQYPAANIKEAILHQLYTQQRYTTMQAWIVDYVPDDPDGLPYKLCPTPGNQNDCMYYSIVSCVRNEKLSDGTMMLDVFRDNHGTPAVYFGSSLFESQEMSMSITASLSRSWFFTLVCSKL
jgi:hypothetical protein